MTLCIAAQCRSHIPGQHAFVLCADGRLSGGAWGADETAIKFHKLGFNFVGLMAGSWAKARCLCAELEQYMMLQSAPSTRIELADHYRVLLERFRNSVLCREPSPGCDERCEVLVTGFISGQPVMLQITVEGKTYEILDRYDRHSIGEGSFAAELLLKHRGIDSLNTDLEQAVYLVYEAKRFGEAVESVGAGTRIKMHFPIEHPQEKDHACRDVSASVITQMEAVRKQCFFQPLPNLGALRTSLGVLPSDERSKASGSRQQPEVKHNVK